MGKTFIPNSFLPRVVSSWMGNEGKGITSEVGACVTHRLLIPSFAAEGCASESLNVAVATAILCAELRRQGRS